MKIKFCLRNEASEETINYLKENFPEHQISILKCLGNCPSCGSSPMAKIEDDLLIGEDTKDLLNKIFAKINS